MPLILAGTRASSFSGVIFTTTEDIDFSEKDISDNFVADYVVSTTNDSGQPTAFKVSREVIAVSGDEKTEQVRTLFFLRQKIKLLILPRFRTS